MALALGKLWAIRQTRDASVLDYGSANQKGIPFSRRREDQPSSYDIHNAKETGICVAGTCMDWLELTVVKTVRIAQLTYDSKVVPLEEISCMPLV
jgi:hypothetical protein